VRPLRIGTRGSALALWQARAVAMAIERTGASAELVTITTRGDRRQDVPLTAIGGKGVFVKEIHDALLQGEIDLAVHSAKDMAALSPEGLTIAAALPREDPRDALVLPAVGQGFSPANEAAHKGLPYANEVGQGFSPANEAAHKGLPYANEVGRGFSPANEAAHKGLPYANEVGQGFSPADGAARKGLPYVPSVIGTGSPRRIAQLRRLYPAARFDPIRGNVDTRLRKLDSGEVDALILACAGLRRLGLEGRITAPIRVEDCVPAPGQGIIAVECRRSDQRTLDILAIMNDPASRTALAAEQSVVAELGGGCQLPLGAFAELHDGVLTVRAIAASSTGERVIESRITGDPRNPIEAGTRLARELASRGARELLNS
jgi:porphobilinogen deaminase